MIVMHLHGNGVKAIVDALGLPGLGTLFGG